MNIKNIVNIVRYVAVIGLMIIICIVIGELRNKNYFFIKNSLYIWAIINTVIYAAGTFVKVCIDSKDKAWYKPFYFAKTEEKYEGFC